MKINFNFEISNNLNQRPRKMRLIKIDFIVFFNYEKLNLKIQQIKESEPIKLKFNTCKFSELIT